jgi:hypothetical protein
MTLTCFDLAIIASALHTLYVSGDASATLWLLWESQHLKSRRKTSIFAHLLQSP